MFKVDFECSEALEDEVDLVDRVFVQVEAYSLLSAFCCFVGKDLLRLIEEEGVDAWFNLQSFALGLMAVGKTLLERWLMIMLPLAEAHDLTVAQV